MGLARDLTHADVHKLKKTGSASYEDHLSSYDGYRCLTLNQKVFLVLKEKRLRIVDKRKSAVVSV